MDDLTYLWLKRITAMELHVFRRMCWQAWDDHDPKNEHGKPPRTFYHGHDVLAEHFYGVVNPTSRRKISKFIQGLVSAGAIEVAAKPAPFRTAMYLLKPEAALPAEVLAQAGESLAEIDADVRGNGSTTYAEMVPPGWAADVRGNGSTTYAEMVPQRTREWFHNVRPFKRHYQDLQDDSITSNTRADHLDLSQSDGDTAQEGKCQACGCDSTSAVHRHPQHPESHPFQAPSTRDAEAES
ncbi:MAG: hypothetical protein LBR33_00830 [Propionibacteriaceae bacterium]|nr:hypothetical protein [Propionibacteriaceae bacterium]